MRDHTTDQWVRATIEAQLRSKARRSEPKPSSLLPASVTLLAACVGLWLLLAYLGVGVKL